MLVNLWPTCRIINTTIDDQMQCRFDFDSINYFDDRLY